MKNWDLILKYINNCDAVETSFYDIKALIEKTKDHQRGFFSHNISSLQETYMKKLTELEDTLNEKSDTRELSIVGNFLKLSSDMLAPLLSTSFLEQENIENPNTFFSNRDNESQISEKNRLREQLIRLNNVKALLTKLELSKQVSPAENINAVATSSIDRSLF